MNNRTTAARIRKLVREYMLLEKDETENSTEWSYAVLEPELLISEGATIAFIQDADADEFVAIAYFFDDLSRTFKNGMLIDAIEGRYVELFGVNTDTKLYRECILGLRNHFS